MLVRDWLKSTTDIFSKAGISSARLDCLILLEHATNQDRAFILANGDYFLDKDVLTNLETMVSRREAREPLAYIVGSREFYGREFTVSSDVLVPRPETEYMVQKALELVSPGAKVLELGTGSGCVAVSLKLEQPSLDVLATDISLPALEIAKTNADALGADMTFAQADLFYEHSDTGLIVKTADGGGFDLICANLPYVPVEAARQPEINSEPDTALYGGIGGLDIYKRFFSQLGDYLADGGVCLVEYDPLQHKEVQGIVAGLGFRSEAVTEYVYEIVVNS